MCEETLKEMIIVYLYRNLLTKPLEGESNEYKISEYQEVMQMVEHFVYTNI